ncbi:hypothetical protein [Geomicrobium sediminis]|uniref:Uncharacterized protein n=1 Tax=Geomicrobium sediminis TaxID=1347788 RepID=A0ABS2P6J4_9BACL|nr:hypothetical protein [Geomicrobium sediminis]MBM7631025.1 hypothetical protein [Geomicrobium sediminis]
MRHITGLYIIMTSIFFLNYTSVFLLNNNYSGIIGWITGILFLVGTVYFVAAKRERLTG